MRRGKVERIEPEPVTVGGDERIFLSTIEGKPSISVADARVFLRGVTNPKKCAWLLALAQLGNRHRASQAIGISGVHVYDWLRDDPAFKKAYVRAMEIASDMLEDEMLRRAAEGVLKPVFQQGMLVGVVREYSDTLIQFALKGAKPDKYAERIKHSGSVDLTARLRAARERALGRAPQEEEDED